MSESVPTPTPDLSTQIRAMVEEIIAGSALYVVEASVRGQKGSQAVEVILDADGPLDVEELARVSRELGFLIETEEVLTGKYNLKVSSPGADKPLRMPRQYRKHVGRSLQVHYKKEGGQGNGEVIGELKAADDDGVDLDVGGQPMRLAYDAIHWAKVKLPW